MHVCFVTLSRKTKNFLQKVTMKAQLDAEKKALKEKAAEQKRSGEEMKIAEGQVKPLPTCCGPIGP